MHHKYNIFAIQDMIHINFLIKSQTGYMDILYV